MGFHFKRVPIRWLLRITPNWNYYFIGISFGKSQTSLGFFYRRRKQDA